MKQAKHTTDALPENAVRAARKRRSRIGWLITVVLVLLIAGGALAFPRWMEERKAKAEKPDILQSDAAPAVIDTSLRAGGTLLDTDAEYIRLPVGVELDYAVSEGDFVSEGDLIAQADKTSLMLTAAELQEAMNELDERIEESLDGDSTVSLSSPADARVKAIYAERGDAISDIMYENGCIMLLSLDGKMAVNIPAAGLSLGQSVLLIRTDESELSGRVSTITGSMAVVTVSDEYGIPNEAVAVQDAEGNLLGSGNLYIHCELKLTGYFGIVESIPVSVNEYVSAGSTLLNLTDADSSAAYAGYLTQRSELAAQMQTLLATFERGGVYAPRDGYVAELESLTEENNDSGNGFGMMNGGFRPMVYMENSSDLVLDSSEAEAPPDDSGQPDDTDPSLPGEDPTASPPPSEGPEGTTPPSESPLTSPAPGEPPTGEPSVDPTPTPTPPPAGFRERYAEVDSVSEDDLSLFFYEGSDSVYYADSAALKALSFDRTEARSLTPDENTPVLCYQRGSWEIGSVSDIAEGDHLVLTYSGDKLLWIVRHPSGRSPSPEPSPSPTPTPESSSGEMNTGLGGYSFSFGGMGGAGEFNMQGMIPAAEEKFTLSEFQVCAITPDENMNVQIQVDELDILSLYEGQSVNLTMDALGQSVPGQITSIETEATANGGSPKFAVDITLQRSSQMRTGMSVAVSIPLFSTEARCSLPVEALTELGSQTVVYTGFDEKNDELTAPVAVTTGVSDGTLVEILSGLEPGMTVYYEYHGTDLSDGFDT